MYVVKPQSIMAQLPSNLGYNSIYPVHIVHECFLKHFPSCYVYCIHRTLPCTVHTTYVDTMYIHMYYSTYVM